MYDTEKLSERIAKLSGGVAVIKVSAGDICPKTHIEGILCIELLRCAT